MDATRASLEGAIAIATHGRGTPSKQALYNAAIDELERRNNGQPLMNVTTYEKAKELLQ